MHQRMYGKRNDEIVRDFYGDIAAAPAEVSDAGRPRSALYREMVAPRIEEMLVPGCAGFSNGTRTCRWQWPATAEPDNVDLMLDRAGLRRYFRAVVDGHQVDRPKPHPDVFLRAAELLGVQPRQLHRLRRLPLRCCRGRWLRV